VYIAALTLAVVASLLAASLYQGSHDMNRMLWNIMIIKELFLLLLSSFSGLFILDCPFGFSSVYLE
jgi:hypothetical protein